MVDRSQVYEPRGFQLRDTNPSFDLTIILVLRIEYCVSGENLIRDTQYAILNTKFVLPDTLRFHRF